MKRHTAEEVIAKLRQAEANRAQGLGVAQACQRLGVSEPTSHRWRNQYGGLQQDDARRLRELQAENARLKRLVAELDPGQADAPGGGAKKVLTAARRRQAVRHLQEASGVSEWHACRVLGQPRSTQ